MLPYSYAGMQVTADIILGSATDTQDAISLLSRAFAHTEDYLTSFEKLISLFEGIRRQQGMDDGFYIKCKLFGFISFSSYCKNSADSAEKCEKATYLQSNFCQRSFTYPCT